MPPPPLPFFRAAKLSAAEEDGLLVIRPRGGLAFTEPPGTSALYLPFARLVDVKVELYEGDETAAVRFRGDFGRVNRESPLFLGELPTADADALAQALTARYGLPREPTPRRASELRTVPWDQYIAAVGTYAPGHFEAADFEGVMLRCADELRALLVPGRRFYVEGFVDPGAAPGAPIVGYGGPTLRALRVEPE